MRTYSTLEIAKGLGVSYKTIGIWIERGFIKPAEINSLSDKRHIRHLSLFNAFGVELLHRLGPWLPLKQIAKLLPLIYEWTSKSTPDYWLGLENKQHSLFLKLPLIDKKNITKHASIFGTVQYKRAVIEHPVEIVIDLGQIMEYVNEKLR